MRALDFLPAWTVVLGIAALAVLLATGLLLLVRRIVPPERFEPHNDVAGFIYAAISVVYAVLLALLVVGVWENYEEQHRLIDEEAAHLITLHRLAGLVDGAETTMAATRRYAELVVADDWPAMKRGQLSSTADEALRVIMLEAGRVPAFKTGGGWADLFLTDLHEVRLIRSKRASGVAASLPGVLWLVLLVGGAMTVGYVVLYGMRNLVLHLILTSALAALVGLSIGVVVVLDMPYIGTDGISTDAFVRAIELMN